MFLYKEHPRHVHTQIFLLLSAFIVQRQFMTSSRNFPLLLYKCFPPSNSLIIVEILFVERQSILSSIVLGIAGLSWIP